MTTPPIDVEKARGRIAEIKALSDTSDIGRMTRGLGELAAMLPQALAEIAELRERVRELEDEVDGYKLGSRGFP